MTGSTVKLLSALGLCFALLATTYGAGSAASTYDIQVRNNSDSAVEFAIFQSAGGAGFLKDQSPKKTCVLAEETRTAAVRVWSPIEKLHATGRAAPTEIDFFFRSSTCTGGLIHTVRLTESHPAGTYTITGTRGHYVISH